MTRDEMREEVFGAAIASGLPTHGVRPRGQQESNPRRLIECLLYFICLWQCFNMISDSAVEKLLHILITVFSQFGYREAFACSIGVIFPTSMYMVKKWLHITTCHFERYVVCPDCTHIYKPNELLSDDIVESSRCGSALLLNGRSIGSLLVKRPLPSLISWRSTARSGALP